jgi:hydroxybutyrate-dimer hydrolase
VSKRIALSFVVFAAACSSSDNNTLPSFVVPGSIVTKTYDGQTDDLLTAGLGTGGLGQVTSVSPTPPPPGFADPANPTAAELRKRAIYINYRALVDPTFNGGYSTLYGPNVDVNGNLTLGSGKIGGEEWLAYDDDGTGRANVTMMVQVPDSFDPNNPCIVTATSSGSRGVYGAIATAGEWGLKHGCAVAYTDKGSGMGVHDLQNNTVNLIDGTRENVADAGTESNFTARLTDAERTTFNTATSDRFAVKHAHSQINPEKDWGLYTLHAIEFAYYVLNQKFGARSSDAGNGSVTRKYHPGQVLTIAASVSNGGGASLAAAEQDPQHWISGVVVGEPQVQVQSTSTINRGGNAVAAKAKPLYDYTTLAALYQGCAAGASVYASNANMNTLTTGPGGQIANRCAGLKAKGLLAATTQQAQSDEALQKLRDAGYEADSDLLHSTHFQPNVYATPAVAITYANAYARASVKDNLCGYSFAAVDTQPNGAVVPVSSTTPNAQGLAQIFANGNGVPPTGPIEIINNNAVGGPHRDQVSVSASTGVADFNIDGAACLRGLWTGTVDGSGAPLTGTLLSQSNALKSGVQQVLRSARLRGIPTILVQGRSDALVPVNHASRAYYGANKLAEGANSPTYYYEVTNAQHFDTFIGIFTGYQTRFIPLHRYVIESLDFMYKHLRDGAPIPPSQVVRTTPRTSSTDVISKTTNVPDIPATPAAADQITFSNGTLNVPE